jgi:hypothetical protein
MRRRLRCGRSTSDRSCRSHSRDSRRHGDSGRRCCRTRTRSGCARSRCGRGRWCHGNFGQNHDRSRRTMRGRYRSRGHQSRCRRRRSRSFDHRLGRHGLRRHGSGWNFRLRFHGGRLHRRLDCPTRRGVFDGSLLLRDGAQHVSRSRNMREVDLGLDLFFAVSSTRRSPRRSRRPLGAAAEMFPHQFRFVLF